MLLPLFLFWFWEVIFPSPLGFSSHPLIKIVMHVSVFFSLSDSNWWSFTLHFLLLRLTLTDKMQKAHTYIKNTQMDRAGVGKLYIHSSCLVAKCFSVCVCVCARWWQMMIDWLWLSVAREAWKVQRAYVSQQTATVQLPPQSLLLWQYSSCYAKTWLAEIVTNKHCWPQRAFQQ